MLAYYESNWLSEGYESPEEEARYREYGKELLTRFVELHTPDFRMPIAVERSFNLDIQGVTVRGFIDRVDKLPGGNLSVVDYKTNKDLFSVDYVENDLQLTVYQMAAEQTWGIPVELLTLYHLRSNTACSAPGRTPERLDETRTMILGVAENIERKIFPATENRFCPCDFPEYCPHYRHLHLTTPPEDGAQASLSTPAAIDAAKSVERYAELHGRIKELQAELDEIRDSIIAYCGTECLNRLFGTEHELSVNSIERTGFSEEEVKNLLKPEGLWDLVTRLDESRLKALIADKDLDAGLRNQLESLRKITSSYPQIRLKRRSGGEED